MIRLHVTGEPPYAERGRTLIELLVALALGLLILLGVGTLYLGANQSTRALSNIATSEESGNVVMAIVGNSLRRAGYSEIVGTSLMELNDNVLYGGPILRGCNGKEASSDFLGCSTTNAASDTLVVWFQAEQAVAPGRRDDAVDDCLGQRAPSAEVTNADFAARVAADGADVSKGGRAAGRVRLVRNVFRVADNGLTCLGNGGNAGQVLVPNVEEFRVFFGQDDVAFGSPGQSSRRPQARKIVDAATLNAATPLSNGMTAWDYVVSVHVCAVMRTQDAGVTAQSSFEYSRCPRTAAEAADPAATSLRETSTDGIARRSYSQVFAVRSRAAASPASPPAP
jgi:type IV pilus assembly protein PilW